MSAPRWKKVWRDLFGRRGRSVLVMLALAAGIFQIGVMLYKYAVLQPELGAMYSRTQPASATFVVDSLDDALIAAVGALRGVALAEARPLVIARIRVGPDEWIPAILQVVRDFDRLRIDTFRRDQGRWPPAAGEVLLERSALQVAKAAIGDSVAIRLDGGDQVSLTVAGTVHAEGLPPAWMEHMVPGFVGWDSAVRGRTHGESSQLRIVVAEHPLDEGYVREVADSVKALLERSGRTVERVTIPTLGRHPHADQMQAFLYLLLAFGILSFGLSAVLVTSMVHAHMSEQLRQIGVMKAIGATSRQIAGLYLGEVAVLALGSLAVGVPLGIVVGRAYASFAAGVLNADISRAPFPYWVIAIEIGVGVLIPLLIAWVPVQRAARITVLEALNDAPGRRPFGTRRSDRWLMRSTWLPRAFLLSMRGTLVQRGRLALTLGMLAIGGAAFISALNVAEAWTRAVNDDFRVRRYDLALRLARPTSVERVRTLLGELPLIERVEFWLGAGPYLIGPSGVPGSTLALLGLPAGSTMLALPLVAGRWLESGDSLAAVVNNGVLARHPGLQIGDQVRLRLAGRTLELPIVGIVKELTPMATVYAPRELVRDAIGQPDSLVRLIQVVTRAHDDATQRSVARSIESAAESHGIEVAGMHRMLDVRQGILDHLVIILSVLTMASLVVVLVGGLGLASSMTLQVVQRTREFGILGTIGATPSTIARHVWFESLLVAVISWVFAMLLAAPISYVLEAACGNIFFKSPLNFHLSLVAPLWWLLLLLVVASLSSFYPARRAARLTVREALTHA
ncbi:MAG: FtsX-like permease family protein [Candidatus Eisenbacteria bacterium]|uniref:FtsX-like permease family protein n=1 Tax=Eiseniibacteriota bacterium TaxID=2212470 RepID=A0A849SHY8_UNCEI|nr:FtsX-like permease family protein [Candidatus Eisenbacteria bacterium]